MANSILKNPWPALSESLLCNDNQLASLNHQKHPLKNLLPPNDPNGPRNCSRIRRSCVWWISSSYTTSKRSVCWVWPPVRVTTRIITCISHYWEGATPNLKKIAEVKEEKPFLLNEATNLGKDICHANNAPKKRHEGSCPHHCFFHQTIGILRVFFY